MNNLLERVIAAHGGLARWNVFTTVKATIVTGGALWGMKGLVQDPAPRQMTVWLHEERASVTPGAGEGEGDEGGEGAPRGGRESVHRASERWAGRARRSPGALP
jgi:hypothetical protein